MTDFGCKPQRFLIIPYQELLGNYDQLDANQTPDAIIPYQELLGNYDQSATA